jgi:hypothetical protein
MTHGKRFTANKIATIKEAYRPLGGDRSNTACGYIARKAA